MKSYPVEFRQKILDVYYNEPISQRQLAKRFSVALSFIENLLKQYRETGDIRPRTYRCGRQPKLTEEQLIQLNELIQEHHGATLARLCELLREKTGVTISRATMGRITQKLKIAEKRKTGSSSPQKGKYSAK